MRALRGKVAMRSIPSLVLLGCVALFGTPAQPVTIDWVTVADPGNACEVQSQGCFGAVAEIYRISKYEVTNAQYAEFLNVVAVADPNGLYNTGMANPSPGFHGGITRSGSSGSFAYSTIAGRENMPVNYVSFWDAVRFANWLHNGQPTGAQDNTTTEDGAYTLTPSGMANNTITRNAGATVFVPSEDEWYKAAYYDAGSASYFDYPAGSDAQTTGAAPGATANTANSEFIVGDLTDVGSYTGAASPSGTFDQGGNAYEWNEAISGSSPAVRGGAFDTLSGFLGAVWRFTSGPSISGHNSGFRVASTSGFSAARSTADPIGISAVQEVAAGRDHYQSEFGAVIATRGFTSAARDLAQSTSVALLDPDHLVDLEPLVASFG